MPHRAALLVAESGGHLDQLMQLEGRLRPRFDSALFVTSETDQSRSLLQDRHVRFVRRVPPRDVRAAARAVLPAVRILRQEGITDVVSTGSAVAVPYLGAARMLGLRAHYIESATRTHGPSMSGKILQRMPGVYLYTQYQTWSDELWSYRGSVFDGYAVNEVREDAPRLDRVVVTLGTMSQYPFNRAVQAVKRVLEPLVGPSTRILWQIGEASPDGLPGDVRASVPADRLRAEIAEADLVVAHAGTGSSLQILEAGRVPLLLPRSGLHGEHIDDHQQLIARELTRRGLAVTADPDDLSVEHVLRAAGGRVQRVGAPRDFELRVESR